MTDVEFEKLMNFKQVTSVTPCLKDLIYDFYDKKYPLYTPESIDKLTKNYIERLSVVFIDRSENVQSM